MDSAGVRRALGSASSQHVRQGVARFDEAQLHRVQAVALASRRRAVGKHVAEVAAAARADLLGAHHAVAGVADIADVRLVVRPEEARPARARIELAVGAEQRQSAEAAGIDAGLLVVEEHAAERRLGTVLEQHAMLVGAQPGGDRLALCVGGRGEVESGHGGSVALAIRQRWGRPGGVQAGRAASRTWFQASACNCPCTSLMALRMRWLKIESSWWISTSRSVARVIAT